MPLARQSRTAAASARGSRARAAAALAVSWPSWAGGPLGIDHRWAYDDGGIWSGATSGS